jgi:hypothetical protein
MLMVIDKETEASATPKVEKLGLSEAQSHALPEPEDIGADSDAYDGEEGRSLLFTYIMIAFFIGLGAIGWAISALF